MNFTLTITVSPELTEAIRILAGSLKAQTIAVEQPAATTTRTRRATSNTPAPAETKEEVKEEVKEESKPEEKAEEAANTESITIETVRAAVQSKAQNGKRDQVKNLLSKFEVSRVTDLEEKKYSKFLKEVNAL